MIIYHGSKFIIENPKYGVGNKKNDYGLGFYCTENIELAKEWACINNESNGYANKYQIDITDLRILDLTDKNYSILNWLAILVNFRTFDTNNPISETAKKYLISNFYINIEEYDIIIGYRADDSYFSFAKDFLNNMITLKQLSRAMNLGGLGIQVVLKTQKAFEQIKFLNYEQAQSKEYYIKRVKRDKQAREEYFNKCKKDFDINDLTMLDIIRRGIEHGDSFI